MIQIDQQLLFLINQEWTSPLLDRVLGTLSCMAFWVPFFVLGAVCLVWKFRSRGLACLAVCGFCVLVNEQVISSPLKKLTGRARPHQTMEGVRRVDLAPASPRVLAAFKPIDVSFSGPPNPAEGNKRSFPSSHTLNATTLGLVFALFLSSRAWLLLPLLMAWSRVYTGAHWPSDVLASLLLGVPFSILLLWGCESFWRGPLTRRRPRWTAGSATLIFPLPPPFSVPRSDLKHEKL